MSTPTPDFQTLLALLDRDYQPDYWSDDVVVLVGELLTRISLDEWSQLASSWALHPPAWQERLADALTGVPQPGRDALLAALLGSSHVTAALSAANALLASRDWLPGNHERQALLALRDRVAAPDRPLVDELLARRP